jgi:hypothetical protein
LKRALHDSLGSSDGILAEALTVAIIVTYARPFTANRAIASVSASLPIRAFLLLLYPLRAEAFTTVSWDMRETRPSHILTQVP